MYIYFEYFSFMFCLYFYNVSLLHNTYRTLISELSVYVSVLTITAFSVERYLAICHPFQARALSEMSRASRTIPAIWLFGFVCALPLSLQSGFNRLPLMHNAVCSPMMSELSPRIFEVSTCLFLVLPMLLMGCLYTRIAMSLRKSGLFPGKQRKDADVNGNIKRIIGMQGESPLNNLVTYFQCCRCEVTKIEKYSYFSNGRYDVFHLLGSLSSASPVDSTRSQRRTQIQATSNS